MRTLTLGLASIALALVLAVPQAAQASCTYTQSQPAYTLSSMGRTYYLVTGCDRGFCPLGVFLYEETNNIAGLQRDDGGHSDTCGSHWMADLQHW